MFGRDSWSSWAPYTPTFAAGTGTIGNGTTAGLWRRLGDSLQFHVELVVGSTTTFDGTEKITLTLPNGYVRRAGDVLPTTSRAYGGAAAIDASVPANHHSGLSQVPAGSNLIRATVDRAPVTPPVNRDVDGTVPFTWDTGDQLIIWGTVPIEGF